MRADRKVALLCLDPVPASRMGARHPFNYAVRRVQAHLVASGLEGLDVHLVESRTPSVEEFVARIEEIDPDVIGASVYVWSFGILLDVVAKVRERRPDIVVIFGGPSARPSMFGRPPFFDRRFDVDALVLGEGEEIFIEIVALQDRSRSSLANLSGLALPTADGWHRTKQAAEIAPLDSLASPYVMGLVQDNVTAHIETFRGCPLSCSFCQWGTSSSKSRIFSREYLIRDFEKMRSSELKNAFIVDAALNLNPRAFRNFAAAARDTGATKNMLLSFEVYPSHLSDEHISFLESCAKRPEIGLGLQSFDKDVLRKLQRPFDEERFENVARMLHAIGCNVAIEIIMGLPGDNPDSFLRTLERAQNLPCEVRVFHCLALPDALMDRAPPWADLKYDPVSLRMQSCAGWSEREVAEMVERLDRMQQFETFDETAWSWQMPSKVTGPASSRVWRLTSEEEAQAPSPPRIPDVSGDSGGPEALLPSHISSAIAAATNGKWLVSRLERVTAGVLLYMESQETSIVVELAVAESRSNAFRFVDGIAVSYRGKPTDVGTTVSLLEALTTEASAVLREIVLGSSQPALSPEGDASVLRKRRLLPVLDQEE